MQRFRTSPTPSFKPFGSIKNWLAMHELEMDACPGMLLVNEWWERMVLHTGHRRKATTSLFMLAVRELWKERNEGFPRQIHHVF